MNKLNVLKSPTQERKLNISILIDLNKYFSDLIEPKLTEDNHHSPRKSNIGNINESSFLSLILNNRCIF